MTIKRAFLTGSHAYGKPGPDSDIDLVVLLSRKDLEKLRKLADSEDHPETLNYIAAGGMPLRFGKLNLICCTGEKMYDIWRKGTRQLKKERQPVTRDRAIRHMKKLRKEAGFCV